MKEFNHNLINYWCASKGNFILKGLLLFAVIILFQACSINKSVNSSFSKRQYTRGYYTSQLGKVPAVAVKNRTSYFDKERKQPIGLSVLREQQISKSITHSIVTKLSNKTLNTGTVKELRKNTILKIITTQETVNKSAPNKTIQSDNSEHAPGHIFWIIGLITGLVGLVMFFLGFLAPTLAIIGFMLLPIAVGIILKGLLVNSVPDDPEAAKKSLGLLGVKMEVIALLLAWLLSTPLGLIVTSASITLCLNILIGLCGLLFLLGLTLCIVAIIRHEDFYDLDWIGIKIPIFFIIIIILGILGLLLLG